jgi:hypothetical protein
MPVAAGGGGGVGGPPLCVDLFVERAVSKRYSEFRSFDSSLRKSRKERGLSNKTLTATLPPSTNLFQHVGQRRKEERRAAFELYLNTLLADCGAAASAAAAAGTSAAEMLLAPSFNPSLASSASSPAATSSSSGSSSSSDPATLALILHFLLDGAHPVMPSTASVPTSPVPSTSASAAAQSHVARITRQLLQQQQQQQHPHTSIGTGSAHGSQWLHPPE